MPSRTSSRRRLLSLLIPAFLLSPIPITAADYDTVSFELPFQGGGMVMLRRTRVINKWLRAGLVAGGGAISRKFNVDSAGREFDAETEALILPYIGPQLQITAGYVGVSLSYGVFWARTKFQADAPGISRISGRKSGWGTGFYAPLLILDFYDRQRNAIVGVGLGGFLGATYPDLRAEGGGNSLTTDESPIDTLTVHVSITWPVGGWPVRQREKKTDDFE